jgi:hypothetical protein
MSHLFPSLLNRSRKVTKRVFKDEQITEATSNLKSSVDSYNNTVGNLHFRIGIKTYELMKGT